jgi:tetratricopeptide (TPR) repeat protein
MTRARSSSLFSLFAIFWTASAVHAGDVGIAPGKMIVVKKTGADVVVCDQDGKMRVVDRTDALAYTVLQTEGDWILINTRKATGWLQRKDVSSLNAARDYYDERIKADAKDSESWARHGVALIFLGDFEQGSRSLTEAIRLKPTVAEWYHKRSVAWIQTRQIERCWADLQEAARLDPKNGAILSDQAAVWSFKGNKEKFRACMTEALRLDPRCADAYCHLAMDHEDEGFSALALADYAKAIECNPGHLDSYNNRAGLSLTRGDFDQAIRDTTAMLKYGSDPVKAHAMRGNAWLRKRDADKALADFDAALKLAPRHGGCLALRGEAWQLKGDLARAIADGEQAVTLDPCNGHWRMTLAQACQANREWARACTHFQAASQCVGMELAGLNSLAWLLPTCPDDKVRNGKKAVGTAQRACDLAKKPSGDLLETLAAAHAETGNFAEAVRLARAALDGPKLDHSEFAARRSSTARDRLQLYEAGKVFREK